jgi:hypothetical protein
MWLVASMLRNLAYFQGVYEVLNKYSTTPILQWETM